MIQLTFKIQSYVGHRRREILRYGRDDCVHRDDNRPAYIWWRWGINGNVGFKEWFVDNEFKRQFKWYN